MVNKRSYVLRTKQNQYNALVAQIERLEAAHTKRYERIGKLREKAQKLTNQLAAKPQVVSDGPVAQ